ncbi:MAG TPA: phosphatidate cytidylyltransferase [Pirellulaceae bacterium]|nr:phosphatidate cytidylyltransferase [Pirellulaceae bacterium]
MLPTWTTYLSSLAAFFTPEAGPWINGATYWLLGGVMGLLAIAWGVGRALRQQPESTINPALVRAFNRRVTAWWMMCAILVAALLTPTPQPTIVLFFLVSFWALREFITMTPTRRGDHRALFWSFFLFTPLQYLLIGFSGEYPNLYGVYTVMIPVYASLFIPARIAFAGDAKRFLERSAKIQAGLLICVYALSHAPAILQLDLLIYDDQGTRVPWTGSKPGLLFYFILVTQLGELFQYLWGKLLGKHVIAPAINASRTWEGFVLGVLSTAMIGTLLWWVTPFQVWESTLMATAIALMGFAGGMTMSAVKRDRGVRDYGTLVQGHAGVLDRIDSICFAAPVFFHLTRYFFGA